VEEQLINLGFVKWPDEMIMKPYRAFFMYHFPDGDTLEVTVKRGKAYTTSMRKGVTIETFIRKFKEMNNK
jgi:hypothetical protein